VRVKLDSPEFGYYYLLDRNELKQTLQAVVLIVGNLRINHKSCIPVEISIYAVNEILVLVHSTLAFQREIYRIFAPRG